MNNTDYFYVVLVKAWTGLGHIARTFSNYEYTHIAICLNEDLNDFITFSRKQHYAPFNSGFMHETIDTYAYGNHEYVKLKVFKIPTNHLDEIKTYIEEIENDKNYIFNIYSMATMPLLHGFLIYKAHNCMSFVSKIIELSESVKLSKEYYHYSIKDIDELLTPYVFKEDNFYKTSIQNTHYMDYVPIVVNIGMFLKLNIELLYRLLCKEAKHE